VTRSACDTDKLDISVKFVDNFAYKLELQRRPLDMATEVVYDDAEPFETYSPALQPPQDIYSNSGEFSPMDYSSGDSAVNCNVDAELPGIVADRDVNGGATVDVAQNGIDEMDSTEKEGSNEAASSTDAAWKVKLRDNWKRQLRRKRKATAHERKYNKSSDNRQSIGGSLSRFVCEYSQLVTRSSRHCRLPD